VPPEIFETVLGRFERKKDRAECITYWARLHLDAASVVLSRLLILFGNPTMQGWQCN